MTTPPTRRAPRPHGSRVRAARGDMLIEALVFLVVVAIVAGAFTVTVASASRAQRTHRSVDIASQASSGLLQQARAATWGQLGLYATDDGYVSTYQGHPTVELVAPTTGPPAGRLRPVTHTQVGAVDVTLTTHVTWATATMAATASAYGTKHVDVVASWSDAGVPRSMRYTIDRTSTPAEAVPDGTLPTGSATPVAPVSSPVASPGATATGADEDGVTGYEYGYTPGATEGANPPPCPIFTVSVDYPGAATLTWESIPGASSYRVEIDDTLRAQPTADATSYTYLGLSGAQHTFLVRAVVGAVASAGCPVKRATTDPPPTLTCPAGLTLTTSPGTLSASWNSTSPATGYNVSIDGVVVASPTVTSYTADPVAGGTHTVQVTSTYGPYESTDCPSDSITVQPPPPGCPSSFTATSPLDRQIEIRFTTAARATNYWLNLDSQYYTSYSAPGTYQWGSIAPGTHTVQLVTYDGATHTQATCQSVTVTVPAPPLTCPAWSVSSGTNQALFSIAGSPASPGSSLLTLTKDGTSQSWSNRYYNDVSNGSTATLSPGAWTATLSVIDGLGGSLSCGSHAVTVLFPPPSCPATGSWNVYNGPYPGRIIRMAFTELDANTYGDVTYTMTSRSTLATYTATGTSSPLETSARAGDYYAVTITATNSAGTSTGCSSRSVFP